MDSNFSFNADHEEQHTSSQTGKKIKTVPNSNDDRKSFEDDHHVDLKFPPLSPYQHTPSPWTNLFSPFQSSTSDSLLYHCVASLYRHDGSIYSIAVSKGTIFTGSKSNRIRAWRQPDCLERGHIKASSGQVRAMLSYGNILFTSHKDYKIRIWNFGYNLDQFQSKKISTLPAKRSFFSSLRLITNSKTTQSGAQNQQQQQQQHKNIVSCMAYHYQEGILYTGSYDKTVKAWRVLDKKCVDSFVAHETDVQCIVVNQDDGCVFTCSSDGSLKIWRRVYKENSHTLTMILKLIKESPVNALTLSSSYRNYSFLYSGSFDGSINVWEKEKTSSRYNHVGVLQGHCFGVLCLVSIGNLIFSGSEDTTIRVWKRENKEGSFFHDCVAVLEGHRGPVKCLVACSEMEKGMIGSLVYSAGLDQMLKVWRIRVIGDEGNGNGNGNIDENDVGRSSLDVSHSKAKKMEYLISPVLSPSWVEKKIQG